jgi:hypothetical protein
MEVMIGRRSTNSQREGLVASCAADYDQQAARKLRRVFRFMLFYRTEVRNTLDVPLHIVWFEAFHRSSDIWVPNNIMRRSLTGEDFSAWYSDGEPIVHGVIPPGGVAVNACNWHGSNLPLLISWKWAYKAEDAWGLDYYAEIVVFDMLKDRPSHPHLQL